MLVSRQRMVPEQATAGHAHDWADLPILVDDGDSSEDLPGDGGVLGSDEVDLRGRWCPVAEAVGDVGAAVGAWLVVRERQRGA
jgi:hypothetical protein